MISNDLENAQIAMDSKDIITDETIIKNHPWVENPTLEIEAMKKQKEEAAKRQREIFGKVGDFNDDEDEDEE